MEDAARALQPAIEMLEGDLADLERQVNGLLTSINLLRQRAGLPPRLGPSFTSDTKARETAGGVIKLHSDTFTGKKLASAVREFLDMRKNAGLDAPATSREIFSALKEGGFASGAKDDSTALVVLRTMLRKNTTTFQKLSNGKYGLRAWYGPVRQPKTPAHASVDEAPDAEDEDIEFSDIEPDVDDLYEAARDDAAAA